MILLPTEAYFTDALRKEILAKIVLLLEQKHLYQNVQLDIKPLHKTIGSLTAVRPPKVLGPSHSSGSRSETQEMANARLQQKFGKMLASLLAMPWEFETDSMANLPKPKREKLNPFVLCLPTIKIPCAHCDSHLPAHNSGFQGMRLTLPELCFEKKTQEGAVPVQVLFFPYQCQSCRGEPLVFTVRREGLKLQIVGRSHFEEVTVPSTIPKDEDEYYKDAVVAFNCGKTLAALFYLRTMLEQYFRRLLNENGRVPGDELAKRYAELLPANFPREFKSLGTVYGELSIRLHAADKDKEQFTTSRDDIKRHFDLLKHFPLKKPG